MHFVYNNICCSVIAFMHPQACHHITCMPCCISIKQLLAIVTQVKVKLNLHGVVGVESVQQVDEEEYEEKVKRPVVKVSGLSRLMRITAESA